MKTQKQIKQIMGNRFYRLYKYDTAMQQAAKRAAAVQPAFISVANVGVYRTRSAGGEYTQE